MPITPSEWVKMERAKDQASLAATAPSCMGWVIRRAEESQANTFYDTGLHVVYLLVRLSADELEYVAGVCSGQHEAIDDAYSFRPVSILPGGAR